MEQYMLLFLGYSISLPIMYYLHFETTSYVMATIIFVIGFIIITLLFTINKAKKIRTHAYKRMPTLFYYKNILIPTMMVLLISTILIVIQLSSLGDSIAKASETSLGQLTVKETFWLQVSIFVSTLILSILGLSECMNALMTARKTEFDMYKTIGWTKLRIFFHFLKEVFVWAGTSIFLGLIVGFVTLLSLKTAYEWILVGVVFAAVLLGLMIILIVMMKNLVKPLQS